MCSEMILVIVVVVLKVTISRQCQSLALWTYELSILYGLIIIELSFPFQEPECGQLGSEGCSASASIECLSNTKLSEFHECKTASTSAIYDVFAQ